MQQLNLPPCQLKIKKDGARFQVFDELRRKFVALTPEEWVRQHFVKYLIEGRNYPAGLTAVEFPVIVNHLHQRADIVVFNRLAEPIMIVECKAPSVAITRQVFDQALRYNITLGVQYVVVTNGLTHIVAHLTTDGSYSLLQEVPDYATIGSGG